MPTVIELERPAQLPTMHRYWAIRADTWDAARAQFTARHPHYAPDSVYHLGSYYYFPME